MVDPKNLLVTSLLGHVVKVKFYKFVIIQLLVEIEKLILGLKDVEDTSFY